MNSRQAALTALERCGKDGAWVSAALDAVIKKEALDRREAALASALAFGVLQNRDYYDYLISCYSRTRSAAFPSRYPEKMKPAVPRHPPNSGFPSRRIRPLQRTVPGQSVPGQRRTASSGTG